MDDASNLMQVSTAHEQNKSFLDFVRDYSRNDMSGWGMFRPVYPAYVYHFYGFFENNSAALYAVNAGLLVLLFYLWGTLFEKMCWDGGKAGRWFFLALCLAFTPHYNLFFFASLQEKFILWGGLLVFASLWGLHIGRISHFTALVGLVAGSAFALMAKATALFLFGPCFIWLAWLSFNDRRNLALLAVFLIGYVGCAYFFTSIRSSYSSSYSFAEAPARLLSAGPRFHLFFVFGLASLAVMFWKNRASFRTQALWPIGLLSYLFIMLPWKGGVGYYLIVPVGVFTAATLLCLYQTVRHQWPRVVWVFSAAVLALSVYSANVFALWTREHSGAGHVAEYVKANLPLDGSVVIAMPEPCYEANLSMSYFIGQPGLLKIAKQNVYPETPAGARKILLTDRYCPSSTLDGFTPDKLLYSSPPWHVYEDQ